MKKLFTVAVLALFSVVGFAQQDPQFSQNMYNRMAVNPAYAGSNGFLCGTLLGRQQWAGFGGGPRTLAFSADMPIMKETNYPGGVGLTVIADKLGFESSVYAKGAYAYRMALGPGNLGIGVELGMLNKSFSGDFKPTEGGKGSANPDKFIPFDGVSKTGFDLGFGLHYNVPNKYYAGVSISHLNAPKYTVDKTGSGLSYLMARHIYFMAGYEYELPNMPELVLRPNLFVKSSFASTQIDLNVNALYNNMIWGGVSMRFFGTDAVIPMFGYQGVAFNGKGNYRIGYSYDVTLSKIRTQSSGSHEIMLGFCYDITPKVNVTRYRNVRML
jgi:type IX secretion system PorP/SprF family membrane protein